MREAPPLDPRVAALRDAFDREFAAPPRELDPLADLLAIRVGGRPYALAVAELAGVRRAGPVTPLPTSVVALSGLAQAGTGIVPVYDLRLLLGTTADAPAGWFVLTAHEPVALAVDDVERHMRVPLDGMIANDAGIAGDLHAAAMVLDARGAPRPLLSVRAVLDAIRARVAAQPLEDTTR